MHISETNGYEIFVLILIKIILSIAVNKTKKINIEAKSKVKFDLSKSKKFNKLFITFILKIFSGSIIEAIKGNNSPTLIDSKSEVIVDNVTDK